MRQKIIFTLAIFLASVLCVNAQVTIGADTDPKATLEVVGDAADATVVDGVIAPRISLAELQAKNAVYTSSQEGVIVYVSDITTGSPTPAGKTVNVTAVGYYYFDGAVWQGFGGGGAGRIKYKIITTTSYTVTPADEDYLIISNTSGTTTITLPAIITGGDGFKVSFFNNNPTGNLNYVISDGSALLATPAVAPKNGTTIYYTTLGWVPLSKS